MGLQPAHAAMIHSPGPGPGFGLDLGFALQGVDLKKLLQALSRSLFAQVIVAVIVGTLLGHLYPAVGSAM